MHEFNQEAREVNECVTTLCSVDTLLMLICTWSCLEVVGGNYIIRSLKAVSGPLIPLDIDTETSDSITALPQG